MMFKHKNSQQDLLFLTEFLHKIPNQ